MKLTTHDALVVAAIYVIILIAGATAWFHVFRQGQAAPSVDLLTSVLTAVCAAAAFCGLFYIRKLYKDVFASLSPEHDDARTSRAATYIYYRRLSS
ncbi:MAG TPA: hypothetical protein VEC11_15135 [Allosphingosinicella sp.]|nr:hypothetical protein [Allosphingosinicella sp.]